MLFKLHAGRSKHILLYIFLLVLAFASKKTLLLKKYMNK
jgi:hypothetical protein